jgi:hypothetical protein
VRGCPTCSSVQLAYHIRYTRYERGFNPRMNKHTCAGRLSDAVMVTLKVARTVLFPLFRPSVLG